MRFAGLAWAYLIKDETVKALECAQRATYENATLGVAWIILTITR